MNEPQFYTSSYSSNGGACIEVATNLLGSTFAVPVRDSKDSSSPVLNVPAAAFTSFVAGIKSDGTRLA